MFLLIPCLVLAKKLIPFCRIKHYWPDCGFMRMERRFVGVLFNFTKIDDRLI